jgi:hypothetical protein
MTALCNPEVLRLRCVFKFSEQTQDFPQKTQDFPQKNEGREHSRPVFSDPRILEGARRNLSRAKPREPRRKKPQFSRL